MARSHSRSARTEKPAKRRSHRRYACVFRLRARRSARCSACRLAASQRSRCQRRYLHRRWTGRIVSLLVRAPREVQVAAELRGASLGERVRWVLDMLSRIRA